MTKKELNLLPKTLIFMVGPSCSGKSQVAWRIKKHLTALGYSVVMLSSDDQRRELLGDDTMDNMHPHMMPVSKQAFELMDTKARLHMSFPVITDFVIVDSTGLDHEMRKQYNIMAKEAGYFAQMIVFDLEREELMANVAKRGGLEHVSGRHMKTLREKVMPALDRKYWDEVIIVRSNEESDALVPQFTFGLSEELTVKHMCFEGYDTNKSHFAVIGDVHECVDELRELIEKLPPNIPLYFIGDMVDKGNNTFAMIDFMVDLCARRSVIKVKGNHEHYVNRRLLGQIDPNPEIEATYMTAVAPLLENAEYREKFLWLAERMKPFAQIVRPDGKDVWLTHAPVKTKYIGKHSKHAIKSQINFRFESRELIDMQKELDFIGQEATRNHPWHVFGHVAHEDAKPFMQHNKIWLDTGCVHGNRLSAAVFEGNEVKFVSVKSTRPKEDKLFSFKRGFVLEDLLVSEVRLSEEEEDQVRRVTKGGAKFISGTMSPAPSVVNGPNGTMDIESLKEGLQYFANVGVREIVIQPKFMGSRSQVYLYKDPEKNFATSRNGFQIRRQDDVMDFVKTLTDVYAPRVPFNEELILDGELMPWAALGKGLIEKDFGYYSASVLQENVVGRLDVVVGGLTNVPVDFAEKLQHIQRFNEQLAKYGSDKPLSYEAFGILSVDGKCWMREDNDKTWGMVNTTPCYVFDPTNADHLAQINALFASLTFGLGYEGIVIKPRKFMPGVLPYMKVRNEEYLRLIYGYDYPDRLEVLCRQKNVRRKAEVALKEYQMGLAMLESPEHREKLIAAFFGQIAKERELDPRL